MKGKSNETMDLWEQHLSILDKADVSPGAFLEQKRLDKIDLPPLDLPSRRLGIDLYRWAAAALVLICTASYVLFQSPEPSMDIQIKGKAEAWLVWKRDGKVSVLSEGQPLAQGDQVGALVVAKEPSRAYMGVFNGHLELLSSQDQFLESGLVLKTGEKSRFPHSFQLDSDNENELLIVFVCPDKELQSWGVESLKRAIGELYLNRNRSKVSDVCDLKIFSLR